MAYDFKKEQKDLYFPKAAPSFVEVPAMTFAAVVGTGAPGEEDGAYSRAVGLLYAFSYTVKMSKKGAWQPEGYFDFVVPPLEGLWWAGAGAFDGSAIVDKSKLSWVSLIRQPDFVTPDAFERACALLAAKKPELASSIEKGDLRLVRFAEGACVQAMHKGSYDEEPATVARLSAYMDANGFEPDFAEGGESPVGHRATREFDGPSILAALDADGGMPGVRLHHEIYLGDPRRTRPENLKTVIRHPVARL